MKAILLLILAGVGGFLQACLPSYPPPPLKYCTTVDTTRLVEGLAEGNALYGNSPVGMNGSCIPTQWKSYRLMQALLSSDSLLALSYHPSPVVRCYAFFVLYDRCHPSAYSVFKRLLQDSATVTTEYGGCVSGWEEPVAEVVCSAQGFSLLKSSPSFSAHFGDSARHLVDSLFLHSDNQYAFVLENILRYLPPRAEYYQRVKELCRQKKNSYAHYALIPLAAYHKKEDIPLLLQELLAYKDNTHFYPEPILLAIEQFPDSAFLRPLLEYAEEHRYWNRDAENYISALRQYRCPAVKNFLLATVGKEQQKRESAFYRNPFQLALWNSLHKHPDPYFDEVLESIKQYKYFRDILDSYVDYQLRTER